MTQKETKSALNHNAQEQYLIDSFQKGEDRLYLHRNKDCVAYKILLDQLDVLQPLLKEKNKWLTIGDYLGIEAQYFTEKNQDVTASDISDAYLEAAYKQNFIKKYLKINVEQIDIEENGYDYLFCKEAFHHFPRAYLGLYEMIRVAKKGVVLIEPDDAFLKMPPLLLLKNICDCFNPYLINKFWKNRFSWEPVGNYVFKITDREIEKIAMGMGLSCIAFKGINIRVKPIPAKWGDPNKVPFDKGLYKKLKNRMAVWNFICKLRIIPYTSLCAVIFKEKPQKELLDELRKNKYRVIELPANPYLT